MNTADRAQIINVLEVKNPIFDVLRNNEWPMHFASSDVDQLDLDKWNSEVSPYWLDVPQRTLYRTEIGNIFEGHWKGYTTSFGNKSVVAEFKKLEALYPEEEKDEKVIEALAKSGYYGWQSEPCLIHQCQLNAADDGALIFDVPQRRIGGRCRVWGGSSSSSNDNSHNHNR